MLLNYHIGRFFSRFIVCWTFGAAGFEWCPCCRLKQASACNTDTTTISWIFGNYCSTQKSVLIYSTISRGTPDDVVCNAGCETEA